MILSPTFVRLVEKITRLTTLLWGTMGFSVLVVAAIAYFFHRQGLASSLQEQSRFAFSLALLILAVGLAILSLLTRAKIWDILNLKKLLERPTEVEDLLLAQRGGAHLDSEMARDLKRLTPAELRALRLIRGEGVAIALTIWGISEAPAMLGLVLVLMGGDVLWAQGMFVLSAMLLFIHRPGFKDLLERIQAVRM